jgi:hypothetical protein
LGAAMLAILAPATLETNCRRDIVMDPPRNSTDYQFCCSYCLSDLSDGSHK